MCSDSLSPICHNIHNTVTLLQCKCQVMANTAKRQTKLVYLSRSRTGSVSCSDTSVNQIRAILPFGLCIRSADQQHPKYIVTLTSRLTHVDSLRCSAPTRMNHLFLGFSMLSETIMTKPFDTVFNVICYLGSAGIVVCCAMIGAVTDMINPKNK